jgi:hypothetical protein
MDSPSLASLARPVMGIEAEHGIRDHTPPLGIMGMRLEVMELYHASRE